MTNNIKTSTRNKIPKVFIVSIFFILVGLSNYAVAEVIPLFPQIKPWDLQSLTITDKNNKDLNFNRKMCVWTLAPEVLATNEVRVTDLADQLIGLTYQKSISGSELMFTNYKVGPDSFDYKIDIGLPEGKSITLYLGSDDNVPLKYARPSNSKNLYLLSDESIKSITMNRNFWLPENGSK